MWALFDILFESYVSEEEFGVTVQGCDHVRGRNDSADLVEVSLRIISAPDIKEGVVHWDTATSQLFEVRFLPLIWCVARIIWPELTLEWPDWIFLLVAVLIVVRKSLDRHVSHVLTYLGEFGMGGHQIALVVWKIDVSVIVETRLEEIVGVWVASEGVKSEIVSGINSVPEPLESGGGGWDNVW